MKSNELIACIIDANPEGGNMIMQKYLRKRAGSEKDMATGLNQVLRMKGNAALRDFIVALPVPEHSNCTGCAGANGNCGCGNLPFSADGTTGASPATANAPAVQTDFLHTHGGVIALSIAAIAVVYIVSKS